jgi:hypothetical protein
VKKIALSLALLIVFSCQRAERSQAATTDAASSQTMKVAAVEASHAAPQRMIVRTAEMRITVDDTTRAVDAVTRSAESIGGYVAGSHVWREGELLRARITLRVPTEKLTSTLAQIRSVAKRVENETLTSDDVSEEFVDLEARVRNLEATEEELRQLLVVARTNSRKASEVLEVHNQLTQIRGEIEQARGRMRYLSQVTAMAAVALEVTPDAIAQPVVEPGWQPLVVAKNAMRALVGVLQGAANAAIWVLIYLLPIAGMLMIVAFGVWRVARRVRVRVSS